MGFAPPSRVLIVGLGGSGIAASELAARDGCEVWATDLREAAALGNALAELPASARLFLGSHPEECLEGVGLVVPSPGVDASSSLLEAARARGVDIMPEIEFAWHHRPSAPLVAVTGSNGKSTVTVLTAAMLCAAGIEAAAGGNLGPPASRLILEGGWDAWVLEISSFQAEILTALRPRVAILLNLSQDHLERHATMADYAMAKYRLLARQAPEDAAVLNGDDPIAASAPTSARRLLFSLEKSADACLTDGRLIVAGEPILAASQVLLSGRHNLANALAAALAARELGATAASTGRALEVFEGLPHRHCTVLEHDGVRWVDDSKATNVGATAAALTGYPSGRVHLILGGQAKGQDFAPLGPEVQRAAAAVYLIGEDGPRIGAALGDAAPKEHCGTLRAAVARSRAAAAPGDTVLLAPACASFDQFSSYVERGEAFAALVREEVASCP